LATKLAIQKNVTEKKDESKAATGEQKSESKNTKNRDWAINLAGGYHHACNNAGGGFCVYADISLAILTAHKLKPELTKFMIVDLDAHQGNGHERDKLDGVFKGLEVFILDIYNYQIYPADGRAKQAIDCEVAIKSGTADDEYLGLLRKHLTASLDKFQPHLIVYNAGTDCLEGDPLGNLDITAAGIVERDEIVFEAALTRSIPIVMVLSGGYQKSNAAVIADSIENLDHKFALINPVGSKQKQDKKKSDNAHQQQQSEGSTDQKDKTGQGQTSAKL
jgi:histone deacetylase 11